MAAAPQSFHSFNVLLAFIEGKVLFHSCHFRSFISAQASIPSEFHLLLSMELTSVAPHHEVGGVYKGKLRWPWCWKLSSRRTDATKPKVFLTVVRWETNTSHKLLTQNKTPISLFHIVDSPVAREKRLKTLTLFINHLWSVGWETTRGTRYSTSPSQEYRWVTTSFSLSFLLQSIYLSFSLSFIFSVSLPHQAR